MFLSSWDSLGKDTGVGRHALLQALPDPGIKPASSVAPALQTVFTSEPPGEAPIQYMCIYRFSSIYTHILFF